MSDELKQHLITLSVAKDAVDAELCAMRLRVEQFEWLFNSERKNAEAWRQNTLTAEATVARVKAAYNSAAIYRIDNALYGDDLYDNLETIDRRSIGAALEGEQR